MTVSKTALHYTSRFRSLQFLKRPFSADTRYPLTGLNTESDGVSFVTSAIIQ